MLKEYVNLSRICIDETKIDGDNMTQKIDEHKIEEIRSNSDIVNVISDYMHLTKRGRNWFGLCPFHQEQSPSFSVSEDKQIFHCFGCGAGGNVITFVMDIEQLPFPEAVSKLGERVGIAVDVAPRQQEQVTTPEGQMHRRMKEAHQIAADYYHHMLMHTEDGEVALQYLESRGFTQHLIEEYQIGYALPSWDGLTNLLTARGFDLTEVAQSGLLVQREQDGSCFDRFRGRVMFPIRDEHGKTIAFSGRILQKSDNEAKYMNSPESPIFHKSEVFFNLDKARATIRKQHHVIIMEGFMDVLAAVRAGIPNAVATMGTSLTPQHVTKLKRLVQQITICYDGDGAGWDAAKRAGEQLHEAKLKLNVAVLPEKMDPDDYVQQYGVTAFKEEIIEKPHTYIAFVKMHARRGKNFQFDNDKMQYVQEVIELLVHNTSPLERDLYIRQLADETTLSEEAIAATLRQKEADEAKRTKRQYNKEERYEPVVVTTQTKLDATDRAERRLLSHMLHNVDVVERVQRSDMPNPFIHDVFAAVYIRLIGFYEQHDKADFQRFIEQLDDVELRKIALESAIVERDPDHGEQEVTDCLHHLNKQRLLQQIEQKQQLALEAEKMNDIMKAVTLAEEVRKLRIAYTSM